MSSSNSDPIQTIGELLAHALELEHESAARYRELAQSMAVHHNEEMATLFDRLATMSETHAKETADRASGIRVPEIPPWEFKWNSPDTPESDCLGADVSYLMTATQALTLALHNETRGRDFYAHVAFTSHDSEVRRLAGEMAAEETEHVNLLRDWLAKQSATEAAPLEDLDPPNMPE
jgi:rubrerythrin